jgi:Outer membrane protein beta-barrel domain
MSHHERNLHRAGKPPVHCKDTMNRKQLFRALVLLASALPLHAAQESSSSAASPLSYDFIDLGLQKINIGDVDDDADGYSLAATTSLGESFYLGFSVAALQLKDYTVDLDSQAYNLSLGYHHALSDTVDLVLAAGPTHLRLQRNGGEGSATGGQALIGLRAAATSNLELGAAVSHQRIKGVGATGYSASARYLFTRHFSVGLNVGGGDDLSNYGASLRWQF